MHYYGTWGYNWWGFPSMLFSIIFWVIIIILLVKLVAHMGDEGKEGQEKEKTESNKYVDIIMERYAKGEINKKEFEQLKKDLE